LLDSASPLTTHSFLSQGRIWPRGETSFQEICMSYVIYLGIWAAVFSVMVAIWVRATPRHGVALVESMLLERSALEHALRQAVRRGEPESVLQALEGRIILVERRIRLTLQENRHGH
jgi:type VI protein secretion system component VasK